jgi:hypothetical protein
VNSRTPTPAALSACTSCCYQKITSVLSGTENLTPDDGELDDWFWTDETWFRLDGISVYRILEYGGQIMLMIFMRHLCTAEI